MKAKEKLIKKFDDGLHICVGLDTDINKIPEYLNKYQDPVLEFNRKIIEETAEKAAAFKINFAFYEKFGSRAFELIEKTLGLIPGDVLTIADAKRGDIGNSAKKYAGAIFDTLNFDAVTLAPYMGFDSVEPFLNYKNKLSFILVLTSNPSSAEIEKLKLEDGRYVYQSALGKVTDWNSEKNAGIVFGATQPEELKENIENFNDLFVLLPGIGAQGGSLDEVVRIFRDAENNNYLINVSRGLIYAGSDENFALAAKSKLDEMNNIVANY